MKNICDPDYIRWTVQTMKFLIVKPCPLPIRIPLGPIVSQITSPISFNTIIGNFSITSSCFHDPVLFVVIMVLETSFEPVINIRLLWTWYCVILINMFNSRLMHLITQVILLYFSLLTTSEGITFPKWLKLDIWSFH